VIDPGISSIFAYDTVYHDVCLSYMKSYPYAQGSRFTGEKTPRFGGGGLRRRRTRWPVNNVRIGERPTRPASWPDRRWSLRSKPAWDRKYSGWSICGSPLLWCNLL